MSPLALLFQYRQQLLQVQGVQLQSWLLEWVMAPAAKVSLLLYLEAEKGAQFTLEQAEYFSRGILTAEGQASSMIMQMGHTKMSFAMQSNPPGFRGGGDANSMA